MQIKKHNYKTALKLFHIILITKVATYVLHILIRAIAATTEDTEVMSTVFYLFTYLCSAPCGEVYIQQLQTYTWWKTYELTPGFRLLNLTSFRLPK